MSGIDPLVRRLPLHAAIAAGVTGAILALMGLVFAAFLGQTPSPLTLALVVAGVALACGIGAAVAVARVAAVRRALGLSARRPPTG